MNEIEKKGGEAYVIHEIILSCKERILRDFWKLAHALKISRDKSHYKVLGYETFREYLATPEISMSEGHASKLIKNLEVWVERYQLSQRKLNGIDTEKLYLASQVATEENHEEWLEKARTLSRSDLITEVQEVKDKNDHEHEWEDEVWERCTVCGKKRKKGVE